MHTSSEVRSGLQENWLQFSLLVLVNAFVGGMVGIERSILPDLAESEFGIGSHTAMLSFLIAFGFTKAFANYLAGKFADRIGRRRLLLIGWLFALPVPLILIYANAWWLIVLANVFLGINQGFSWSTTVIMKIDLVGQKQRGLAMGINEFAGYLAVGVVAFFTGYLASEYGVRPVPFYMGIAFAISGLLLSFFFVKDTRKHVALEVAHSQMEETGNVFRDTTYRDANLGSITQAGLINNLNDGMIWGLLPAYLMAQRFGQDQIGLIAAVYPAVWGVSQLFTGVLSDKWSIRNLITAGMALQALAIWSFLLDGGMGGYLAAGVALGLGTALVYPTFLSGISRFSHPGQRAESLGIFRMWRDLGYAIGAIFTGVLADLFGMEVAIFCIATVTAVSALLVRLRMDRG